MSSHRQTLSQRIREAMQARPDISLKKLCKEIHTSCADRVIEMKYAECALCRRYSKKKDDCRGNGDCVLKPGMTSPSMFKGE